MRLSFDPRLRLREPVSPAPVEPLRVESPAPRAPELPEAPADEPSVPPSDLLGLVAASTPAREPAEPVPLADDESSERALRVSVARVTLRLSRLGSIAVSLQKLGAEPVQVEIVLSDPSAAASVRARAAELVDDFADPAGVRLRIRSGVDLEGAPPDGSSSVAVSA